MEFLGKLKQVFVELSQAASPATSRTDRIASVRVNMVLTKMIKKREIGNGKNENQY